VSTNREEDIPKFLAERSSWEWVSGFLLAGSLVGLIGSLLVVWQYHIEGDPKLVGLHFLGLNAGYLIGSFVARRLLNRRSIRSVALLGCGLATAGLVSLSFLVPPIAIWWRLSALGVVGFAAGLLMTSLLYALDPYYQEAPAASINLAGTLFGLGCLVSTIIAGGTYFVGVQTPTMLLAILPLVFFFLYLRNEHPAARCTAQDAEERHAQHKSLHDLRSVAAILFSLLLFFQFGNEWAIAGWLPLFLIHRLGINPELAIFTLGLYFLALLLGRILSQALLRHVAHRRLLLGSIVIAMLGYLLLSFTDSIVGAAAAVVVIGAGFAPIYPLVAEKLDDRFAYSPGFYNGIFSVAITGGMAFPWLLGYVDASLGMRFVMLVPAFGSIMVLMLVLLIMLEAHLMGGGSNHLGDIPGSLPTTTNE
jgi:FHS family glucose/mannose:H+ symporter-like MFS transporter